MSGEGLSAAEGMTRKPANSMLDYREGMVEGAKRMLSYCMRYPYPDLLRSLENGAIIRIVNGEGAEHLCKWKGCGREVQFADSACAIHRDPYNPRDDYERGALECSQAFNKWMNAMGDKYGSTFPAADTSRQLLFPILEAHRLAKEP